MGVEDGIASFRLLAAASGGVPELTHRGAGRNGRLGAACVYGWHTVAPPVLTAIAQMSPATLVRSPELQIWRGILMGFGIFLNRRSLSFRFNGRGVTWVYNKARLI